MLSSIFIIICIYNTNFFFLKIKNIKLIKEIKYLFKINKKIINI